MANIFSVIVVLWRFQASVSDKTCAEEAYRDQRYLEDKNTMTRRHICIQHPRNVFHRLWQCIRRVGNILVFLRQCGPQSSLKDRRRDGQTTRAAGTAEEISIRYDDGTAIFRRVSLQTHKGRLHNTAYSCSDEKQNHDNCSGGGNSVEY